MSKIRPLRNKVVVRICKKEQQKSGIIIPESGKERQSKGTVLAVGPGIRDGNNWLNPPDLHEEDVVIFHKYAGTPVDDDDDVFILTEEDILGVVE